MNSGTGRSSIQRIMKSLSIAETAVVMTALLAFEAAAGGDVSLSDTVTASARPLKVFRRTQNAEDTAGRE